MPLIYSFVARRDGTVVAEHAPHKGNSAQVASECLQHVIASSDPKMTITCDKHTFNFLKSGEWIFLGVADEAFGRQVPFAYLDRISEAWAAGPANKARSAAAHSFDRSFGPRMKDAMEQLNSSPETVSKVAAVQKQVEDVKSVMVENIEQVLARGDRIQLLVDRTEDLQAQAQQFQKQGRQLRTTMWWGNVKVKAAIAAIILLVLAAIVLAACFSGGGNRCSSKKAPPAESPAP
ncbi:hypothetical protein Rsub_00689 [Raphidocelis subcapitata]|uniref:Uncharacterized protein n=1 Tax=Raphidocelis subcapitata TaxID=307507 RepID=A0A2V0NSS5_9CHLO|nr:hypothetical protein Rsub_00689 [Raphidocelis subcapitata]|eukprot:GBF87977.1 hypothetical protein Rsub_00689 [Raphidocelis subcapitata]